jgi:diacylglycerol kinase (ATP)
MASNETRGPKQIVQAARYSGQGFLAAWRFESSFRLEVYLAIVLFPVAFWMGRTALERAVLAATILLVLTVELMNSAVEAIVDKASPEWHPLAGRAKDLGSAAVSGAMMIVLLIWLSVAWSRFA